MVNFGADAVVLPGISNVVQFLVSYFSKIDGNEKGKHTRRKVLLKKIIIS